METKKYCEIINIGIGIGININIVVKVLPSHRLWDWLLEAENYLMGVWLNPLRLKQVSGGCHLSVLFFISAIVCSRLGFSFPSSSMSTGWMVALNGDRAICCHAGLRWAGRAWSASEKSRRILRNDCMGNEPGPRTKQSVRYIHSPTEPSWLTQVRLG